MKLFKMAVAIDQQQHHDGFKPFKRSLRCKLQSFGHLDHIILELSQTTTTTNTTTTTLSHHRSLKQAFQAFNIHRSFSTPCLPLTTLSGDDHPGISHPRIEIVHGSGALVHALVAEVAIAMASGVHPSPLPSGLGGAYVFCNRSGNHVAVAKPVDEEPIALHNPNGGFGGQIIGQQGLKSSIRIGETGIRELAAYLLDHGGFAGVPPTVLVKFCHAPFFVNDSAVPKLASLQRFIGHGFDAGELGPSFFSVSSVHQIGILDIRLLNLDRHAGNMLVMKHDNKKCLLPHVPGVADLVPIDHGFCLPEWLDDPYFEWLHWPQASIPFSESELEYISMLNPFKDAEILRNEIPNSLRESSIRVLFVCTIFLKQAAFSGLCLADIGQMMTREFCGGEETPSELEKICSQVKASILVHHVSNNGNNKGGNEEGINCEVDGISFGDLSQVEWESFMENFEEVLNGVFGDKKNKT